MLTAADNGRYFLSAEGLARWHRQRKFAFTIAMLALFAIALIVVVVVVVVVLANR